MTSLSCRKVSVRLDGQNVLDAVDLDVGSGEWVTLVGPNGAGKSTLMRAIAGLVQFAGDVSVGFDGASERLTYKSRARARARMLAYVPQHPVIPSGMSVRDYVLLGRSPYVGLLGVESASDVAHAHEVIESLGLLAFAVRDVHSLSGGEWQRVVLARALAQGTGLLLLDEPTTSLDIGHQQEVLELIDRLRRERGLTVLSTMHELTLAGQYADRLALLAGGSIVAEGSAAEVLTDDNIERHYGAFVRVHHGADGITLVPLRRR